ncbi:MAG: InlB B-repeat-containing protein [Treponema sp.]|nr:InlB B-repeat-containing protein [Treponema sp.]
MKNTILTRAALAAVFFAAVLAAFALSGCPNLTEVSINTNTNNGPYTVTFDSQGGSDVEAASVESGAGVETLPEPVKPGYTFAGWYTDPEGTKAWTGAAVTGDITVYAKWTQKTANEAAAEALRDAGKITVPAGGTGRAEIVFGADNKVTITIGGEDKTYDCVITDDAIIITKEDGGKVSVEYEIAEDGTLSISGLDKIDGSLPAEPVEPETENAVEKPAENDNTGEDDEDTGGGNPPASGITYTAAANGTADTVTSTAITFTFSGAITGLSAADITITGNTGAVTKGSLTGSGKNWSLGITVQTAGEVKVKITKDGVKDTEQTVTVHKNSYTAAVELRLRDGLTRETWTGQGTAEEGWTLNVTELSTVYVAVYKEAAQTITVSGTDSAKVTQASPNDNVDGITVTDEEAVFTVETGDLVFDGGERTFTLDVNESGALSRKVNVTLNVNADKTGAAVFKLVKKEGDVEFLERLGDAAKAFNGLVSAFTWVEQHAEANTEYTIRVEKNESNIPHLVMGSNAQENVTLRFKGTKEGPFTLDPVERAAGPSGSIEVVNLQNLSGGGRDGFIQIGGGSPAPQRTFILGKNITIQSYTFSGAQYQNYVTVFYVDANATLILEPGSKITDHNVLSYPVINVQSKNIRNSNKNPTLDGKLRIEGGSIINWATSDNSKALIELVVNPDYRSSGCFYLAGGSVLALSGNSNNKVKLHNTLYDLDLANGMSLP